VVLSKINSVRINAYTKAGAIAEQALNAIKTVVGLGGEYKEVDRYSKELSRTEKVLTKFGFLQGLSFGALYLVYYCTWGVGFIVGSKYVANKTYNDITGNPYSAGDVLTVFFSVVSGVMSLGQLAPSFKAFQLAKQTAYKVFNVIERTPLIDYENRHGAEIVEMQGNIKFENVTFNYPANPDKVVLNGLNLKIEAHKKTALVGESGSGKSTVVQLIERFYDAKSGSVTLDRKDLKSLKLSWLRKNISYVGQEPVLFSATIRENLSMARDDEVTEEEMIDALKKANAYDFILGLKDGLDTYVGISGTQISGGQKQRIAIARAILRNSKILLLDEATSALDRKNEKEIQETLDSISVGRTTIIIAHRLSTVKNADMIFLLANGKVEESGTHQQLVDQKGKYFNL